MYTIILRITQDQALSEDVLQEVFIKLFQSPPKPSVKKPRAYLFQMARNLAIDNVRRQVNLIEIEDIDGLTDKSGDTVPMKMDIEAAMRRLPLTERQITSLHLNAAFKFREIAEILEIPLGTVLWRYQKSIQSLRNYLNGES